MKEVTYSEMMNLKAGDKMTVVKEDRHSSLICDGIHPKISKRVRRCTSCGHHGTGNRGTGDILLRIQASR